MAEVVKIAVASLEGAQLDAAVARCEGYTPAIEGDEVWLYPSESTAMPETFSPFRTASGRRVICQQFQPSRCWDEGGPIIERERITTEHEGSDVADEQGRTVWTAGRDDAFSLEHGWSFGPTPLIAAMRFFVRTKLGDEIELPQ